jgi:putative PIN family toxin of toxin-antitoxin system
MSGLVVLDTNVVLDLFLFADPAAIPLLPALAAGRLRWIATHAMRDELERVLAYPHLVQRLAFHGLEAREVLGGFDTHAQLVPAPAKVPLTCRDPDDQKFIDLAVAQQARLLSKDRAVLSMKKRLAAWSVEADAALPAHALPTP